MFNGVTKRFNIYRVNVDRFIITDTECSNYVRNKLSFLFDFRAKKVLKLKPKIINSDFLDMDTLLESFIFDILIADVNEGNQTPLVKYCNELYNKPKDLIEAVMSGNKGV